MKAIRTSALPIILTLTAAATTGCADLMAKYKYSQPNEKRAEASAEWVKIYKNDKGYDAFYDPYQLWWDNQSSFTAPFRLATANGTYTNAFYTFSCYGETANIIKTLGGTPINKEISLTKGSVASGIRNKICGFSNGKNKYGYIGLSKNGDEFYFNRSNIAANTSSLGLYRFEMVVFSSSLNKIKNSGYVELDCNNQKFRSADDPQWKTSERLSPANILDYQFCRNTYLRNSVMDKYSDFKTNKNIGMTDYIDRLNKESEASSQKIKNTPAQKPSTSQKQSFDWSELTVKPKSN